MELRHLRYFVAAAEELNFRRAAERLHISQPPLSLQIRQLETDLGAELFERTRRGVFLTPTGRLFLDRARHVLAEAQEARSLVKRAHRGEEGELKIAFTPSVEFLPFFPQAILRYRELHPGVKLTLKEMESAAQIDAVAQRTLDVGIARKPKGLALSTVKLSRLWSDPLMLAAPAGSPFASAAKVSVAELREQPFVCNRRDTGAGLFRAVMDLCWAAGFTPQIAMEVREVSTVISLVAAGLGVAIVPASMQCLHVAGVRYVALAGNQAKADLFIVAKPGERSLHVAAFAQVLQQAAKQN